LFGRIGEIYYSQTLLGVDPPASGPVIFVANHPNGLVDPILVGNAVGRRLLFLAKAPLFKIPILGALARWAGAIPVFRRMDGGDTSQNDAMFAAVYEALAEHGAICLFPEGISHNEPELQPLKTGAARMALGAQAAHHWSLGVQIVPVGLTYRSKTRFQSSVAIEIGRALETSSFQSAYEADPVEAARALTAQIRDRMTEVTLNLEQWNDLPLLQLAERLLPPGGGHRVQRLRSFAEVGRQLERENPRSLQRLRERLAVFSARLEAGGIDLHHLEAGYAPRATLKFVGTNLLATLIGVPLTILGSLAYAIPFFLVRLAAMLAKPTADIASTVKIIAAVLFFPLMHAVWTALVWQQAGPALGFTTLFLLPIVGLYARHFLRRRKRAWREARVFLTLPFQGRRLRLLTREAQGLRTELLALAERASSTAAPERS
jgi:1-acyl-sn-glycerol-3-phosphate acyltransferase